MLDQVTAIRLLRAPMAMPRAPFAVHHHVSTFGNHEGLHAARLDSLAAVQTPWAFFWDDTDRLPEDVGDVLTECMAARAAVA